MPSTELAQRADSSVTQADAARISKSKLVPEHIADDAASVEYMMRIGEALGIAPVSAFQHIYVFPDGKGRLRAGMSAHLMQALAIAAGHTVHVEGNALKATAILIRKTTTEELHRFNAMRDIERQQKQTVLDNLQRLFDMQRNQIRGQIEDLKMLAELGGEGIAEEIKRLQRQLLELPKKYDFEALREQVTETSFDLSKMVRFKSEWTKARANDAGLSEKGTWQSYGPEMLKARAKSSVVRDGAIDVILGIKRIMNDLGLEFSDEMDDEIAVNNVLYPPEELGAEVDADGVPIQGRVVNVTASGVSKTQDRLVQAARKIIDGKPAAEVREAVLKTLKADLPQDEKVSRLDAFNKAIGEAGRGGEEVMQGDESWTLSAYLEGAIHTVRTTDETRHEDEEEGTK